MKNEKRLIKVADATAVYNGITLYMAENAYLNDTALDVLKMVAGWLNEAPTVDAVEVVHGRWFMRGGIFRCSECDSKALLKLDGNVGGCREYTHFRSNYCPNCGADMRDGDA